MRFMLCFLSSLELLLIMLGIFLPIGEINQFWLFNSEFSVFKICLTLFAEGELIIAFAITFFGIFFPILKVLSRKSSLNFFDRYNLNKFSMLDIFLLALLIFSGKVSTYFDMELKIGFYMLVTSVALGYLYFIMQQIRVK